MNGSGVWRWCLCLLLAAVGVAQLGASARLQGVPETAFGRGAYDDGDPRVEATLLVDATELRSGQQVRVGVLLEMDPGWHIYWRNSGESGLPTQLEWRFDHGDVGPIRWPVPEVFEESDGFLTTYGYHDKVLLASDAMVSEGDSEAPSDAQGSAKIAVTVDFVTCNIGCIPGRIELSRSLPVSDHGRGADPSVKRVFDTFAARLPARPAELGLSPAVIYSQSAVRPDDEFRAAISFECDEFDCPEFATVDMKRVFLPDVVPGVTLKLLGSGGGGEGPRSLILLGQASPDPTDVREQRLRGLIALADGTGDPIHVAVDFALPRAPAGSDVTATASPLFAVRAAESLPKASPNPDSKPTPPTQVPALSLVYAFGLALLGGLILNLMPCVLPILALKVLHVAELAHESRRKVMAHGASYTAGVMLSMGLLAAVVVALREAGAAVGWGFQFQEPLFVATISTVLVVFALNLFGVFEVTAQPGALGNVGADATGLRRSFFEGLLAVVLATPCTAPFLGTAVGFAFASSTLVIFTIFLTIGFGLAAPYALITLAPAWAKVIPRPGAWMLQVRRGLGFSLLATTVWLLWVVGRASGLDAQTLLLGYLVGVAFLTWIFGVLQNGASRGVSRVAGVALAGVAVAALVGLPLEPTRKSVAPTETDSAVAAAWRPWDPSAIGAELARGRPVFVDFTASWCITCKVNESVVLESARVLSEFERLGIVKFKADWTLYDDDIRQMLARFGKAGVPMYLVYQPGAPDEPKLLPELLTIDLVLEAIRNAASGVGV